MSITSLSIRHFRSISSFDHAVGDLNIFVGQNDEGKSNILRALDLFFNHNKPGGYLLDWSRDFCAFAPQRRGKADEIVIEIVVSPPGSFSNRNPVVWRKSWRKSGIHSDSFGHKDGTDVSAKSKIAPFLRAMRFDYVPAIKSPDYFGSLMAKLHDMLEATVEEQVRAASGSFTATIGQNTATILAEIRDRLGLETTIELPSNLRDLFTQLEFTSISANKSFSLNQRGDGIKVRHIPIVLKWLAEQANHLSAPGRPKTVTVWGYEEPENNLELKRCFELAEQFVNDSAQIQTFVTTHSPAFYSIFRDSAPAKVKLFLVAKGDSQSTSTVVPLSTSDMGSLDSSMGLMSLLEPHFKQAREEIDTLQSTVATLNTLAKPAVLVEGPTDARLLTVAWSRLNPTIPMPFVPMGCGEDAGAGGAKTLNAALRYLTNIFNKRVVAVFDNDREGAPQFEGLRPPHFIPGGDASHRRHKTKDVHAILLPTPSGREAFVPATSAHRVLEIEHYFSDELLEAHGMKGPPIYNGAPVFEVTGDKTAFAAAASTFSPDDFGAFEELFQRLVAVS